MTPLLTKLLQWLILTLLFPLVFLNAWLVYKIFEYFHPLVTTLVLGSLFAFILNYPVSILQKRGIKRSYGVTLIFIATSVLIVALTITLVPIILQQFHEMVQILPQWLDSGEQKLNLLNDWVNNHGFKVNISETFGKIADSLPQDLEYFTNKAFHFIIDTIDSVSEALITVVLTFYLLVDGERIWHQLFSKLPKSFSQQVQQSLQHNFQNFLIGQIALALLMGVSLTLLFLILRVPFGLVFGLGIGILSLIPFGDVVSLGLVTLIISLQDLWLGIRVLAIAVVIDQLIDQAIAPRLLGSFTGLRPVWVLISLLVGTYVGGLLGLLLAVPLAGFIKDAVNGFDSEVIYPNAVDGEEMPIIHNT